MISFTTGNLLASDAEALVNTVNTVGIMGKGIALMFKEAFPENFRAYEAACRRDEVEVGRMFVFRREELVGPKWIVNFPTKRHWRHPSKLEWIAAGLADLRRVIHDNGIRSIALPPLGAGNGGLDWHDVRPLIESALAGLDDVAVIVHEPTATYQNVAKRSGVQMLTPPRALIAELVRQYGVLGMECSLLEIQKLAWFLERCIGLRGVGPSLDLRFVARKYGPYAHRLTKLLEGLDGSYLHCDRRVSDAVPSDAIWFDAAKVDQVRAYLTTPEARLYGPALDMCLEAIDGFQSPFGLELLATVDWLTSEQNVPPKPDAVRAALAEWPAGAEAAARKRRIFSEDAVAVALRHLTASGLIGAPASNAMPGAPA